MISCECVGVGIAYLLHKVPKQVSTANISEMDMIKIFDVPREYLSNPYIKPFLSHNLAS